MIVNAPTHLRSGEHEGRKTMKRFEQLHIHDQIQLLLAELEVITAEPCNSVEELAETQGVTVLGVWREICAEAGLDECTPWEGFPALPMIKQFQQVRLALDSEE
jgi:hypothetical protein